MADVEQEARQVDIGLHLAELDPDRLAGGVVHHPGLQDHGVARERELRGPAVGIVGVQGGDVDPIFRRVLAGDHVGFPQIDGARQDRGKRCPGEGELLGPRGIRSPVENGDLSGAGDDQRILVVELHAQAPGAAHVEGPGADGPVGIVLVERRAKRVDAIEEVRGADQVGLRPRIRRRGNAGGHEGGDSEGRGPEAATAEGPAQADASEWAVHDGVLLVAPEPADRAGAALTAPVRRQVHVVSDISDRWRPPGHWGQTRRGAVAGRFAAAIPCAHIRADRQHACLSLTHPRRTSMPIATPIRSALVACALLAPAPALAQQPVTADTGDATLTVTASGAASARPDEAVIRFGVETRAQTAGAALDANNARMARAFEVLEAAGLPRDAIATDGLSLSPVRASSRSTDYERGTIIGYQMVNRVSATTPDIAGVGQLLDALVEAGINTGLSLDFRISDPEPLRIEARGAAARKARQNAEAIAASLGTEIEGIVSISEGAHRPAPMRAMRAEAAQLSSVPVASGGAQDVSVSLTVVFAVAP